MTGQRATKKGSAKAAVKTIGAKECAETIGAILLWNDRHDASATALGAKA